MVDTERQVLQRVNKLERSVRDAPVADLWKGEMVHKDVRHPLSRSSQLHVCGDLLNIMQLNALKSFAAFKDLVHLSHDSLCIVFYCLQHRVQTMALRDQLCEGLEENGFSFKDGRPSNAFICDKIVRQPCQFPSTR